MAAQVPSAFIAPQLGNFQPFQPNFQLIAGALQSQQQFFDKTMEEFNRTLQALPGDTKNREQIMTNLQNQRDQVIDLYANEGVGAGSKALKQAGRDIRRDFTSGTAARIQANYKTFSEFQKGEADRLAKNEISKAQYARSVTNVANTFSTIDPETGQAKDISPYLTPRAQQIDADKFMNDFLKNVEADQGINFGEPVLRNGVLHYLDKKGEYISKDKIMKSATAAYLNAVKKTGQLVDEYYYRHGEPDAAKGRESITKNLKEVESKMEELKNKSPEELLKWFQDQEMVTVKTKDDAVKMRGIIEAQGSAMIEDYSEALKGTDEDIQNAMLNQFMFGEIKKTVEPYADAKSYYKDLSTMFRMKDPLTEQMFMRQLSYDEWLRNNAMPNLQVVDPAQSFKPLSGDSYGSVKAYRDDLAPRVEGLANKAFTIATKVPEIAGNPEILKKIQGGDWSALFELNDEQRGMTKDKLREEYQQYINLKEEVRMAEDRIREANKEAGYDESKKPVQSYQVLEPSFKKSLREQGVTNWNEISLEDFLADPSIIKIPAPTTDEQGVTLTPQAAATSQLQREQSTIAIIQNSLRGSDKDSYKLAFDYAQQQKAAIKKRDEYLKKQRTVVSVYSDWNIPGLTEEETIQTRKQVEEFFKDPNSFSNLVLTSSDPDIHGKNLQELLAEGKAKKIEDFKSSGQNVTLTKQPLPNGKMAFRVPIDINGVSKMVYITTDQVKTEGISRIVNSPKFLALSNFNRSKSETGAYSHRSSMFDAFNVVYDFQNDRIIVGDQRIDYGLEDGTTLLGNIMAAILDGKSVEEINEYLDKKHSGTFDQQQNPSVTNTYTGGSFNYKEMYKIQE